MPDLDNIVFRIKQSSVSGGQYTNAVVHAISGTLTSDNEYQKYMVDIIAHALTNNGGVLVEDDRFTYTFPFKFA